ncbi:hypothetical protein [Halonatronum saccharophilum]|uniref:hypothetical protein n=1 Tax=Halonatronum saccharophilum TaxID=150060 RepID=UPI0004867723|nr:hypothetical protein [Halonatronum saccharophilum]
MKKIIKTIALASLYLIVAFWMNNYSEGPTNYKNEEVWANSPALSGEMLSYLDSLRTGVGDDIDRVILLVEDKIDRQKERTKESILRAARFSSGAVSTQNLNRSIEGAEARLDAKFNHINYLLE